ncbi:hypothetical protein [Borreliella garinii]|uniref:hypothetical protein n=1 Tax=Borreliella garinii TaxID=29519 RepID=UPI00018E278E|nr:hypothetical protein [Borreliella garinii]EED30222.1 conserved hypothetical protein [Borreliella garinii Far04]WNZ66731.1 hypothetical protein PT139_02615 [Borreliella garinii]WNZ67726.1 hypothetical protein PT135_02610 [Borreliella garinii]WNZ68724.1 hypothetical protein PT138_02610 [Borreliella garinii]WNZ69723.1 hypothetical protein PT140_02610 [Borreliella garinii]
MKGFLRAVVFNLLLGLLILFVVIFLQFRNLNLNIFFLKDIKLEVNNTVENSEYILNDIVVNVRGLRILLSKLNPLIVLETGLNLLPVSYKVQDMGIYVYFENNIFLGFLLDLENNFSIESNLSKSFLLSYEVEDHYEVLLDKPTISIRQGENLEYRVFLGENVKLREKDILISPQATFRIGSAIYIDSPKKNISNLIIESNKSNILDHSTIHSKIKEVDNKIFNDTLNNFRQSAYDFWNNPANFNVSRGGWLKYGDYGFDENLMVCFLAESLIRGDHESIFLKLNSLLVKNEHKLTYLSLNYYANSDQIDKFISYLSRNKTFIDSLEKDRLMVYLKEDPRLLEKIFLSENGSKLNDALNLLKDPKKILSSNFDFIQTYNILSNYLTFLKISNDDSVYLDFKKELYRFVFTLFGVTDEGKVYILNNDNMNSSDVVEYAVKISGVLKRIASYLKDNLILKLSFNVIYYSLMNDYVKGIPYESYYSDIIDNQYMPQFIFIPSNGSIRWIYAASRILNRDITDTKVIINFDQEINYSSYIFFGNILNPTLVRFREIDWFTDYKFYIYSDGWKYYPSNKILVIKATPKKKKPLNLLLRFEKIPKKINIYE